MSVKTENALVIRRVFDAPRELVWETWTNPEKVKKWWGPKMFTAPAASMDFRVGGTYLFCMRSDEGPEAWQKGVWSTGTYKEILPMEKIVSTDSFADENGNIVSATYYGMNADFPREMLVTVALKDYDTNKTKLVLMHEGIPGGEDRKGAIQGWNESFDKLEQALASSQRVGDSHEDS